MDKYLEDNLKAPNSNGPKSAFMSKPSTDVYFGQNKEAPTAQKPLCRNAYALGSGGGSIGLDQRAMKIHPFFHELIELKNLVTRALKLDADFEDVEIDFNFCSVKVYHCYKQHNKNGTHTVVHKTTNWHTDVTFDPNGIPLMNNTQKPNTPVLIVTFGDDKDLIFQRRRKKYNDAGQSMSKDEAAGEEVVFHQRNGSMTAMHPADEVPQEDRWQWKHMSKLVNQKEGVCFSFMFRQVQKGVPVKRDGSLLEPSVGPIKGKQFDKMRRPTFGSKRYKQEAAGIYKALQACIDKNRSMSPKRNE